MLQLEFKRYEKKFLMDENQAEEVLAAIAGRLSEDFFPRFTVSNIYFDTEDFLLIQRSIDDSDYKEKLRLRVYGDPGTSGISFIEFKKKYEGMIYKRRVDLDPADAEALIYDGAVPPAGNPPPESLSPEAGGKVFDPGYVSREQIIKEVLYMRNFYGLRPKVLISYFRSAFFIGEMPQVRITFDKDIKYRFNDLHISSGSFGKSLLAPGMTVMEIKTPDTIPSWLTRTLSGCGVYMTPFSKYGYAYRKEMTLTRPENAGIITAAHLAAGSDASYNTAHSCA